MFKNNDYSFLSKTIHHLALNNNFIQEMLHDIELSIYKKSIKLDNLKSHIFISGLPRSGTTALMNFLYKTEKFASLTYRDMPFIVSPNLWSKISKKIKAKPQKERMHSDNLSINIDSPEALDEIFWRIKLQKKYIFNDKLIPHEADEFTITEFRNFVSLILYKYNKEVYLSKNNNNILRLESLIKAYPNCLIIIPFRDPLQQAYSLLKQHEHFTKIQNEDKFTRKYMSYLVHYEFGTLHRPYYFEDNKNVPFKSGSLDYWLLQWVNTYTYLLKDKFSKSKNIMFINYESFCKNPKNFLQNIIKKTNLDDLIFKDNYNFKLSPKKVDIKKNEISTEAYKIFEKLLNICEVHD